MFLEGTVAIRGDLPRDRLPCAITRARKRRLETTLRFRAHRISFIPFRRKVISGSRVAAAQRCFDTSYLYPLRFMQPF